MDAGRTFKILEILDVVGSTETWIQEGGCSELGKSGWKVTPSARRGREWFCWRDPWGWRSVWSDGAAGRVTFVHGCHFLGDWLEAEVAEKEPMRRCWSPCWLWWRDLGSEIEGTRMGRGWGVGGHEPQKRREFSGGGGVTLGSCGGSFRGAVSTPFPCRESGRR